jgi:acyl-CoA synthetase
MCYFTCKVVDPEKVSDLPRLVPTAPVADSLRSSYLADGWWDDTVLADLLVAGLRRNPAERVHVWSKRHPVDVSFAELEEMARRIASGLSRCGVVPGDRVVYWLPNGLEAVAAYVGLALAGAVIVPVATFYGRRELIEFVNAAGAEVVITCRAHGSRDHLDEVLHSRDQMPGLRTVIVCDPDAAVRANPGVVPIGDLLGAEPAAGVDPRDPDDVCLLIFTSGTSGTSKGVLHTHRTLGAEIRHHLRVMMPPHATPQVVASPIAHAAGMTLGLLGPVHRGEPIHLADEFDVDFILDTAVRNGLAPGGGAAVFLSALIDHPAFTDELAERMGHVILGGSTVPGSLVDTAARRGITVLRSYGLTEHPTVSGAATDDPPESLRHTDGRVLPGVEVQIRDGTGDILPSGTAGEIFTRGPDRCAGYLDPAFNASLDADGWLSTGDIGVLGDDGRLAVTARAKDMIIRNGINVSPAEVESAIATHVDVEDVAVIGVPHAVTGERAVAVVIPRAGADVSLATLTAHLASMGVAKPKWPEDVMHVADLPRTASGKVRKDELRQAWALRR